MSGRPARERRRPRVYAVARKGKFFAGEPLFERGAQISLAPGASRPREGQIVVAELDGRRDRGRVAAVLGSADVERDVVTAVLAERGIEVGFDAGLEVEAERAAQRASSPDARAQDGRRDLTALATFTVDPASARDFDDAVSAQPAGSSIRLWVHIADVASYVPPGSGLDLEARERATSAYVPGAVAPMLPAALSDDVCSLAPGLERRALTTELDLGSSGKVERTRFYRSLIRSDARLDYDQLDRIFAGRDRAPEELAEPLRLAREAAAALGKGRSGDALEVTTSEPEFEFDSAGDVVGARGVVQTEAHELIERLMVCVNEQVAGFAERRSAHLPYRVHERPDPARIELLFDQLASLDVPTPPLPESPSASEAARLVAEASRLVASAAKRRGHGREAYTSLVLRSLKQASYSPANIGHAGLGSPAYAHFTSPIRRYPDLLAHRALLSELGAAEPGPSREEVTTASLHCSEREREAARVEREADDVCAAYLLARELAQGGWGKDLEGEVSGVVGAGAFVRFAGELADVYEGFVPARLIRGDRYELNPEETGLVGRRRGKRVRMGDPITVRVESIDAPRGRVDLSPVSPAAEGS